MRNYFESGAIPRAEPLAKCPDLVCRRSGHCRHEGDPDRPCIRLYESMDERRERLAARIRELRGSSPSPVFATEEDKAEALARVYKGLQKLEARNQAKARAGK